MRIVMTALFCLLLATPVLSGPVMPDTIVLAPEVLYETRQKYFQHDSTLQPAYEALLAEADRALDAPILSVTQKPEAGPSGDKHDYWSVSPYWWPDPEKWDGKPYVKRDGERNPKAMSATYDCTRMNRMSKDVATLALAYYLSQKELYAIKATAQIRAWFFDRTTRMNPHMKYAQTRPGVVEGHHSGIIETRDLIRVVDAARLLEPSHAWTRTDTHKLEKWFGEYVNWLMHSDFARDEAQAENNHGTWFDAQVAVFAVYAGNEGLARSVVGTAELRRVIRQIMPNGSMPKELKRTRSRHYTFFNLEAFFVLAAVAERFHMDLWNWRDAVGHSIRQGLDFAAEYIDPAKEWPHGKTGKFNPAVYIPLFRRAALVYKDETYLEHLDALPADMVKRHWSSLFY